MSLVYAYQNRGLTKTLQILDADDAVITPGSSDLVRVVIGREGEIGDDLSGAKFSVTSGTPTANGSSITKGATNTLRLDASDLDFDPGTYTLFLDYFDADDSDEWKNVSRQVFVLEKT